MPDDPTTDDERQEARVASRADLLPEEDAAGSDDPDAQARAILEESDERTESRDAAPDSRVEHRSSDEVTEPTD